MRRDRHSPLAALPKPRAPAQRCAKGHVPAMGKLQRCECGCHGATYLPVLGRAILGSKHGAAPRGSKSHAHRPQHVGVDTRMEHVWLHARGILSTKRGWAARHHSATARARGTRRLIKRSCRPKCGGALVLQCSRSKRRLRYTHRVHALMFRAVPICSGDLVGRARTVLTLNCCASGAPCVRL